MKTKAPTAEELADIRSSAEFDARHVGAFGCAVRQRGEATLRVLDRLAELEATPCELCHGTGDAAVGDLAAAKVRISNLEFQKSNREARLDHALAEVRAAEAAGRKLDVALAVACAALKAAPWGSCAAFARAVRKAARELGRTEALPILERVIDDVCFVEAPPDEPERLPDISGYGDR